MILCSLVYGEHWTNNPTTMGNMNAIVRISVCGEEQLRTDYEIAAFYGDEVRGVVTNGYAYPGKDYVFYLLTIGGNEDFEEITFKLYDPITGKEYHSLLGDEPFYYMENSVVGDKNDPIMIDFYHWDYQHDNDQWDQTMTIVSTVQIDGVPQERENLEIAALCQGKVRSLAHPVKEGDNYILYLSISGSSKDKNKEVTFMLYDHSTNEGIELQSDNVEYFVSNSYLGTLDNPVVINFITPYIAKIGETKYETLQDAVDAYEGETITMIKNAQCETAVTIAENLTIDFAGFTYNGALDLNATLNVVGDAGNVTSIVLNEGAQVYHSYALETTIVRNVEGTTSGWGTLSAPTAEGNVAFNYVCDHDQDCEHRHDFYQYVESEDLEWKYIGGDVSNDTYTFEMEVGRGYLYANQEDVVASFTGTLNMDDVNYVLSCTNKETDKELSGLNMIGNPFTHNINVNHLDGEIAEAFYSVATSGAWVANVEGSVIAPLQAVLVQTNVAGPLAINKEATKTRAASEGSLKINVANKNYNDVAYVLFKEGLGLSKIAHFNTEIPMVSVNVEGKEYAVATMNKEVTEIPVSFKAMTMGEYTISVEAQDVEETIYLTDKLTGERVNLNTDSYTFMATSNDNTDRFVLTKVLDTTGIEQNAEYSVYVSNDEIRFNNVNGNLNVRIYDMLGRPVAEYNVYESATISTSSFETGMYILQMTDENGVRTQKVLVD